MVRPYDLVVSFHDIDKDDGHLVGGKSSNIAEGFAITHRAYFKFLHDNRLEEKIRHLISSVNFDHHDSLAQVSQYIKNLIVSSKIPDNISYKVFGHYQDLGSPKVILRMSVVTGDLGQRQNFSEVASDIKGEAVLLDTMRFLWARLFKPEIMIYRYKNNIDHLKTGAAVVVQSI